MRTKAAADLAAIDAFQARGGAPPRWPEVESAWRALGPAPREADFARLFDPLAASFVNISDESGLTVDPDAVGIDLADGLTYRLPRAVQQFQSARRDLCDLPDTPAIAARLVEAGVTVSRAEGLDDGLTALANATTNCFPMILISGSSEREIVDYFASLN